MQITENKTWQVFRWNCFAMGADDLEHKILSLSPVMKLIIEPDFIQKKCPNNNTTALQIQEVLQYNVMKSGQYKWSHKTQVEG